MLEIDFRSHKFWGTLAQTEASLEAFSPFAKADPRYQDIKRKVEYLRWTLESSDPFLVGDAELLQLRNELQNVFNHLGSDASNFQHLPTIASTFSAIIARFPYPRIQRIFKSEANAVINELKESASVTLDSLKLSADELGNRLAEILEVASKGQAQIKETTDVVASLDSQLAAKMDSWDSQFVNEGRERVSEFNAKFSEFISEKTEELRLQIDALRKDTESSRQAMAVEAKLVSDQRETERRVFAQELGKHKALAASVLKEIEGMYEVAGQTALSGGFVEAAVGEKTLYEDNAWYAKFFFILAAIALAALWAYHLFATPTNLNDVLLRLPISLVFFVPAVYFSRLASKHRLTSVGLQSLGLRIKAFDAYLISAKETERQKLRAEMANVFFDDAREKAGGIEISEPMLSKLTDKISQLTEKVVEKLPIGDGKA
jgi:hypothetical protein